VISAPAFLNNGGSILSRLYEGLPEAIRLIISFDPDLLTIVLLSLRVSITAIIISTLVGVPLGALLGPKSEKKTRQFVEGRMVS
jgi:ABC-type tungstate transport system substrate-binding protein